MKKKTYLIVGLFLAATLAVGSFSAVTLAWIMRASAIEGIRVDASSLGLSLTEQKLYKYVFPRYKDSNGNDTNIVDYLSQGEAKTVSGDANMNPLDPTYLNIQHILSQDGIGMLNTSLALEFSFSVTYTTSIDLYVLAEREYDSFVPSVTDAKRVSDYIHFDLFRDTEIAGYLNSPLENNVFKGNGTKKDFVLTSDPSGIASVTVGGEATNAYSRDGKTITFDSAPANNAEIVINYSTIWHAVKKASEEKAETNGNKTDVFEGDGTNTSFDTSFYPKTTPTVTVDDVTLSESDFTYVGQTVTLNSAPNIGARVAISYSHSTTHTSFPFKEDRMAMEDFHLVLDRPSSETTTNYKFYLNIEYNYDLASSDSLFNFFTTGRLGKTYALDKDYRLSFGVKQGAK
ncbi:MAG: hypothetical protein K6G74_00040 [Bacilli bacterium]|nr:hypothetical protein [Bacilli bacterium]